MDILNNPSKVFAVNADITIKKGGLSMKIERISENQIRCTLNRDDLNARQLKISELAYGSEKVKELFHEICSQASAECDFEADDVPLMIEAIPVSLDCLVLVVTKVNDPDELDTRFSNFTEPDSEELGPALSPEEKVYADEVISCFEQLHKLLGDPLAAKLFDSEKHTEEDSPAMNLAKIYSFGSLDEVITTSKALHKKYHGSNTLYKDADRGRYYLVVNMSDHTAPEFNKICNMISEYASAEKPVLSGLEYLQEHYETIIKDNAVQVLYKM